MPNFNGFTYGDIISRVSTFIGNDSVEFRDYVAGAILLAEMRYFKMHDWSFLRVTDIPLTTVVGQTEYTLNFNVTLNGSPRDVSVAANEIETIRAEADNLVLKRVMLDEIRRLDPDNNDGSNTDTPSMWAVAGQNKIRVWPPTTKAMTLKIDAKVTPALPDKTTFSALYPIIPFKYQEAFIEYVIAMALDRENDDRALQKKQEAMTLVLQDIQSDLDVDDRIRSMQEFKYDGVGELLDIPGFRPWD